MTVLETRPGVREVDGVVVVHLDDADGTSGIALLRWHTAELLPAGATLVVVDVAGLSHLSSTTLAAILWARQYCRTHGVRLVIRNPGRKITELLARTAQLTLLDEADRRPL